MWEKRIRIYDTPGVPNNFPKWSYGFRLQPSLGNKLGPFYNMVLFKSQYIYIYYIYKFTNLPPFYLLKITMPLIYYSLNLKVNIYS